MRKCPDKLGRARCACLVNCCSSVVCVWVCLCSSVCSCGTRKRNRGCRHTQSACRRFHIFALSLLPSLSVFPRCSRTLCCHCEHPHLFTRAPPHQFLFTCSACHLADHSVLPQFWEIPTSKCYTTGCGRMFVNIFLCVCVFSSTESLPHQWNSETGAAGVPTFLPGPRAHRHGEEPGDGNAVQQFR